ncbi:MAG: FAD-dependent oxidoreductase [Gracilimonas sp.]|nr:FAD-dependent oxidoreductase [Gracilimonas sp.]
MSKNLIIIGGGFAGISAAQKLASADVNITIIDKPTITYFNPCFIR